MDPLAKETAYRALVVEALEAKQQCDIARYQYNLGRMEWAEYEPILKRHRATDRKLRAHSHAHAAQLERELKAKYGHN